MSKSILVIIALLSLPIVCDAKSNNAPTQGLTLLGSGKMKVMFWQIYHATFFATKAPYRDDIYPQALILKYLREIEGKELLNATQEQWQHLNVAKADQQLWLTKLSGIFPDVRKGDRISLLIDKQRHAKFYFSEQGGAWQLIGAIEEPRLGPAFLAIWLSKNTSRPKLRAKLLGESS